MINWKNKHLRWIVPASAAAIFAIAAALLPFQIRLIRHIENGEANQRISRIQHIISDQLQYILTQEKYATDSGALDEYIKRGDSLSLLALITDISKNIGVPGMSITDAKGTVLARAIQISQRGDNLFQTTEWGHLVEKGQDVMTIDSGKFSPLLLLVGHPIIRSGTLIGAIFAGVPLNNDYALHFQQEFLQDNGRVAFYSKTSGITGDGFDDPTISAVLNSNFTEGDDIVCNPSANLPREVEIGGRYYLLRSIPLPSIQKCSSAIIKFIPVLHASESILFAAVVTLFLFIFKIVTHELMRPKKEKSYIQFMVFCSLAVFALVFVITNSRLKQGALHLKTSPYIIYNSTIGLNPESDIVDKHFEKRVTIDVSTGGESINSVQVTVTFDPTMARVADVIMTNSFCDPSFVIEKSIDNIAGNVRIICGVPNPGFSGNRGAVADLLVQPLKNGQLTLAFSDDTMVLANDGLGTNVLRQSTGATYQVSDFGFQTGNMKGPLPIFSYTHPNTSRWYNTRHVSLGWPDVKGYTFRYAINQDPTYTPRSSDPSTTQDQVDIDIPADGIYYFHLLPEDYSTRAATTHYQLKIDTRAPTPPDIKTSSSEVKAEEIVRFGFLSQDSLSGLQGNYYIRIGTGLLLPIKAPVYIPFPSAGKYPVTIRAFDQAGNFSEATVVITVHSTGLFSH